MEREDFFVPKKVTKSEVLPYLDEIKLYAAQRSSKDTTMKILKSVDHLENEIYSDLSSLIQTKLNFK